ncbi:hypothetical protein JCM16303_001912 [Sporobolomyces ruberrimus]
MTIPDDWAWYHYDANRIAPIVASVLFFLAFLLNLYRTTGPKRPYYTWPFTLGCFSDFVGYVVRRVSADHPAGPDLAMGLYLTSSIFIVLAPNFAAAAVYMTFGRLVRAVGIRHCRVPITWLTVTFVTFDVAGICVQAVGTSLYGSPAVSDLFSAIKAILVVGFLIQIVSFSVFFVISVDFHIRARRAGDRGRWERALWVLYSVIVLILVRNIYRLIEFATSTFEGGYILSHETYFWVFEFVPILLASYMFGTFHPPKYFDETIRAITSEEEIASKPMTEISQKDSAEL